MIKRAQPLSMLVAALMVLACTATAQTAPDYEIYAVEYYPAGEGRLAGWVPGADTSRTVDGSFMVWLIREPGGRTVLIDAGYRPEGREDSLPEGYVRPDSAIARLGIAPEDVTDIILTHLHWDHADGIPLFPNAHVWIQEEELAYYATTAYQEGGDARGVEARNVVELVELNTEGRVTLVDGDDVEIMPGIRVYTGARHTHASMYLGIETPDGTVVLASDNAWFYANLELGLANALTFDADAQVAAQERMNRLASRPEWIIPGHDALIFERFPNPVEGVAKIR